MKEFGTLSIPSAYVYIYTYIYIYIYNIIYICMYIYIYILEGTIWGTPFPHSPLGASRFKIQRLRRLRGGQYRKSWSRPDCLVPTTDIAA